MTIKPSVADILNRVRVGARRLARLPLVAGLAVQRRFPRLVPLVRPIAQRFPRFKQAYWSVASETNGDPLASRPGEIVWLVDPDPAAVASWLARFDAATADAGHHVSGHDGRRR